MLSYSVESDSIEEIKEKFKRVLQESNTNNAIQGYTANLVIRPGASPIFHKDYTVPYALLEPVYLY